MPFFLLLFYFGIGMCWSFAWLIALMQFVPGAAFTNKGMLILQIVAWPIMATRTMVMLISSNGESDES